MGDENAFTPLNQAASLDIVKFLVEKGAQNFSMTMVEEFRPKFAEHFASMGADVNVTNKEGQAPLFFAAWFGGIKQVRTLLEHGASVTAKDSEMATPLHVATELEIVKCLIDHGASIEERDSKGKTPLMNYVMSGKVDLVQCLMDHGADIFAEDDNGLNAIHFSGNVEVFNFLSEKGLKLKSVSEALHFAAAKSNTEVLKLLLEEHGGNIQDRNKDGKTLWISSATDFYSEEHGELLHSKKADINATDHEGQTPLHLMCQLSWDYGSALNNFSKMGANISAKDLKGCTALHYAASKGYDSWVENLILKKADVNVQDYSGATPLHHAATVTKSNACVVIWLLLLNGAKIGAQDGEGKTPLHHACKAGSWPAVDLLLDHNADVNLKDFNGLTPLEQAKLYENHDVKDLLISRGATEP